MLKGQLGISAAILAILLTIGGFFLISSDGNQQGDQMARKQAVRAYHTARRMLELDSQRSRALAQHYARMSQAYFKATRRYQTAVSEQVAKAASAMEEDWSPDFVALVNTQRIIVWSQLNSTVTKTGTPVTYATNRVMDVKWVTSVLTGRGDANIDSGPLPFQAVTEGSIRGVAVPLLGAGKVPIGALVLAWKGRSDERQIKAMAEQFRDKLVPEKVDVVPLLLPKQKIDRNLEAMLRDEFPEDIKKKHGVNAAFIGLLDRRGILVARSDKSRLYLGKRLKPKSLALQTARAQHETTTEVWLKEEVQDVTADDEKAEDVRPEILRVGVAPIMGADDKLQGVLLLAWEVGDVYAMKLKKMSGADMVFFHQKTLSTTTLKSASAAKLSGVPRSNQGPGQWKAPSDKTLSLDNQTWYAAAASIPASRGFSFVVLSSVDQAQDRFGYARVMVLVLGGVLVVVILLVSWLLRRYFIMQISELEKGVADIVAGNMEHTFGVPARETEGLAYILNVLMAQLLGRPEPGEEEESEEGEGAAGPQLRFSLGPLPDRPYRPGDSQLIPRLDEDKESYYQRIFKEYLAAMQELGEDTAGFELAAFRGKLEVNERMICARLKCSEVRFSVVAGEEEVVLQPYPVA
jgi:hypothetical protein